MERTLGVLKKRFPIFKVATFHMLKNQVKLPIAAAIFHNLIREMEGDEEWLDDQPDNINPEDFVVLPSGDQGNAASSAQGNALRDSISREMWVQYEQHGHGY